jgi:hypothetical protein
MHKTRDTRHYGNCPMDYAWDCEGVYCNCESRTLYSCGRCGKRVAKKAITCKHCDAQFDGRLGYNTLLSELKARLLFMNNGKKP